MNEYVRVSGCYEYELNKWMCEYLRKYLPGIGDNCIIQDIVRVECAMLIGR